MAQRNVVLASGKRAVVSDEWIARWPEDVKEVIDAIEGASPKRSTARKNSAAKVPPQKPAPEVPEHNNSSVDEKKEST